jgi:hypothetical protein
MSGFGRQIYRANRQKFEQISVVVGHAFSQKAGMAEENRSLTFPCSAPRQKLESKDPGWFTLCFLWMEICFGKAATRGAHKWES